MQSTIPMNGWRMHYQRGSIAANRRVRLMGPGVCSSSQHHSGEGWGRAPLRRVRLHGSSDVRRQLLAAGGLLLANAVNPLNAAASSTLSSVVSSSGSSFDEEGALRVSPPEIVPTRVKATGRIVASE